MASWPQSPKLIGGRIPRLDGLGKASGKTKYPSDVRPDGTLFGVLLTSPVPHAKIKSIDTAAAEKMPGVKAIHLVVQAGGTLRYQGETMGGVAAESEEKARDAARAIKVEYEILPHVATEEQAMAPGAPQIANGGNVRKGREVANPKVDEAYQAADFKLESTYSIPVITHVCLESHGLAVRWDNDDHMTVWASTQNVGGVSGELAGAFQIPATNVHTMTEVMGGGFGSKFGADVWGVIAGHLSKKAGGKPVRMFLDRSQEHLTGGNRPSGTAHIKLGASKDGMLTAMIAETYGTGGASRGANFPMPYVYSIPNAKRSHSDVYINGGDARAMRAPGHPQACALMEAAMDDIAAKIGVDPLEFRIKNLAPRDFRTPIYLQELELGAKEIGWKEKWKPRGRNGSGTIKRGLGLGMHQWGGGGTTDKQVSCTINPDGSVEVKSATQDLGTGTRTILAIITAEVLGLKTTDITSNIGDSLFPPGQPSGGSTTAPSMSPPAYNAALQARDAFFQKIAPALAAEAQQLSLADGQVLIDGQAKMSWKDACRKLGMGSVSVTAGALPGLSSNGVGGCQFAEAEVDVETGVVKLKKIVAVQDSGLIIDMLTWESQVYGGVIGGINPALFEERVMDPGSGLMLNADMEMYKLAGASDIPEIVVIPLDTPEMRARGVIGVGEPPTISTAAAIRNAVSNAIGVPVNKWPMTPMNVLDALAAAKQGKA